ncbi:MAG: phosphoglucosamine mutase [Chloroflexi bacterium]|nr:phosphoglucosamine mutase [Chloroflexota bacterium]
MSIFGSSGIREIADERLLGLALQVGLALGQDYRAVVIGRDSRTSSAPLANALAAGLSFSGALVHDAGLLPTPALAYAAREFHLGAMVTASHNPPEYNGIKIFNPDGSGFGADQRQKLEAVLSKESGKSVSWDRMGTLSPYPHAVEKHLQAILSGVNVRAGLKVVVDCGCGAASLVTPYLLARLGCKPVALNSYPSGFFPRPSEPLPENLSELIKSVTAFGADLGLAHDGDADRVVAVDHKGRFVPGDKLIIILARQTGAKKLFVNIDSSMAVEEQGFDVARTRVGDAYISEDLKARGGDFGGEPSGAFMFPRLSYCPDGIYGAALLVQAASQRPLAEWVDEIPEYPILRGATPGTKDRMPAIEEKLARLNPLRTDRTDGLRLTLADGWLLVRPSGTEPKIRITAEATTGRRAEEIFESGRRLVEESIVDSR